MKSVLKSKLSAMFVLLITTGLVGCSEGAYTPSAQNANVNPGTYYGPNGVPTNQLNPIPNQYPNYQMPVGPQMPQMACQPVMPNCMNIHPNVCAQLRFQAMFQARQRCPSVMRCDPTANLTPIAPGSKILKNNCLKKKVVKRCSTCVPQYIITSSCDQSRDDDRRLPPVYSDDNRQNTPTHSIPSGPSAPAADTKTPSETVVASGPTAPSAPTSPATTAAGTPKLPGADADRQNNDHTASTSEESELDDSRLVPILGNDAKELYNRLDRIPYDGTNSKGQVLVKTGTHLKCTVTHPKQLKEQNLKKKDAEYICFVQVAIEDGQALDYDFGVSDLANGKETLKEPTVYAGEELSIGTRGTKDPTIGIIVTSGLDAELTYDNMSKVQPKENQFVNEDESIKDAEGNRPVGTVKLGTHSRCYQSTSSVGKPTRCVYKLDTIKGVLLKAEDLGGPSADEEGDKSDTPPPVAPVKTDDKQDIQQEKAQQPPSDLDTRHKDQAPNGETKDETKDKTPTLPVITKKPEETPSGTDALDPNAKETLNQNATSGSGNGTGENKGTDLSFRERRQLKKDQKDINQ